MNFFRSIPLTVGFLCIIGLHVASSSSVKISMIQTAMYTGDRLTPQPPVYFSDSTTELPEVETIKIDTSKRYQEILGFGGAFTEASAYVTSKMNPDRQQEIFNAYFGPSGHKYSVGRVHINSCDFSLESYNFDDVQGDYNLVYWNFDHDIKERLMLPFIKSALNNFYASNYTSDFKLYASPWSPPAWMKTNGNMSGSDIPCLKKDDKIYQTWAKYLSRFVSEYEQYLGIEMWGITPQNEPTSQGTWEVCVFEATDMRDWIKNYFGPQMRKDHPNLNIIILDDDKEHLLLWVPVIISDPESEQYVDGIGFHWYWITEAFEVLSEVHAMAPKKFLLPTEACNCPGVNIGDWDRGESYGKDILGDLKHWAVGWVDWNLVLDTQGGPNHGLNFCDAQIIADYENQTVYYQPTYYYMGHFSRFIPPGSVRIGSSNQGLLMVDQVAFLTPQNEVVVVVLNLLSFGVDFVLQDGTSKAHISMPERSIVTLTYQNFH